MSAGRSPASTQRVGQVISTAMGAGGRWSAAIRLHETAPGAAVGPAAVAEDGLDGVLRSSDNGPRKTCFLSDSWPATQTRRRRSGTTAGTKRRSGGRRSCCGCRSWRGRARVPHSSHAHAARSRSPSAEELSGEGALTPGRTRIGCEYIVMRAHGRQQPTNGSPVGRHMATDQIRRPTFGRLAPYLASRPGRPSRRRCRTNLAR